MADSGVAKRFDRVVRTLEDISDPIARLDEIRQRREDLERLEARAVIAARREGATWRSIGALYGLSKQGAQQRFRPLVDAGSEQAADATGGGEATGDR